MYSYQILALTQHGRVEVIIGLTADTLGSWQGSVVKELDFDPAKLGSSPTVIHASHWSHQKGGNCSRPPEKSLFTREHVQAFMTTLKASMIAYPSLSC